MRVLEDARSELLDTLDAAGFGPTLVWSTNDSPPGGAVHWAGTARMNRSSEHGVCDGTGRIHGVENVAVGDASVFPTPVEKNPTLTLMALSARSALALARRLAG